mmetsp:Transcript_93556/g.166444  ORF Transcript_93556/g.166444 Transcript_93556/m.166444 type:complete len:94 (+) Transcript_93556:60-341(+)
MLAKIILAAVSIFLQGCQESIYCSEQGGRLCCSQHTGKPRPTACCEGTVLQECTVFDLAQTEECPAELKDSAASCCSESPDAKCLETKISGYG